MYISSTDEDARQAMMLDRTRLKDTQVHLLLSSRAEMQKVIETARLSTMSFMSFSTPTATVNPVPTPTVAPPSLAAPFIAQPAAPQIIPKPQPPVITSNSLSGILAQQMYQQHQLQVLSQQQNMPLLTSTSVRHEIHHPLTRPPQGIQSGNDSDGRDMARGSHSRSKSRERRRRSRSRDRSRRNRSRSSERYRKRRNRSRDRSRGRSSRDRSRGRTSRERNRSSYDKEIPNRLKDVKNVDGLPQKPISVWDNPPGNIENSNNAGFQGPFNTLMNAEPPMSLFTNVYNIQNTENMQQGTFGKNNPLQSDDKPNCIRIENVDPELNYSGIRKFFAGLHIPNDGVKIINDENGRRSGVAVVRFARPFHAMEACNKTDTKVFSRRLKISIISSEEYDKEVDSYRPPRRQFNQRDLLDEIRENDNSGGNRPTRNTEFSYNNETDQFGRRIRGGLDAFGRSVNMNNQSQNDDSNNREDDYNEANDDDDVVIVSDSIDRSSEEGFTTLKIENVPPYATEQDIIKMFSDFTLVHIVMAKIPKDFQSFVKFHNKADAAAALNNRQSHIIGHKVVRVLECPEKTFEEAKAKFSVDPDFLQQPDYQESSDENCQSPNIPSLIDMNVNCPGQQMNSMQHPNLSDPRMRKQQEEFQQHSHINRMGGLQFDEPKDEETNCVFMSNLDFKLTDRDIVEWFAQVNIIPARVHLLLNTRGRPSGDCFCEFDTPIDAKRALSKNRTQLLSRKANLKLIPQVRVMEVLSSFQGGPNNTSNIANAVTAPNQGNFEMNKKQELNEVVNANKNNKTPNETETNDNNDNNGSDIDEEEADDADDADDNRSNEENSFTNNDNDSSSVNGGNIKNPFKRTPNNIPQMDNDSGMHNQFMDGGHMNMMNGMRPNMGGPMPPRQFANHGNNNQMMGGGGIGFRIFGNNPMDQMPINNMPNNNRNTMGCIVSLRNVPFQANIVDILQFFSVFQLSANDVIRRYRDDGSPTGDARVCFKSMMDARRAVEQYHNSRIMNRNIQLSLL